MATTYTIWENKLSKRLFMVEVFWPNTPSPYRVTDTKNGTYLRLTREELKSDYNKIKRAYHQASL